MKIKTISSSLLKAEALRLGFSACGIAPIEKIDSENQSAFRQWLSRHEEADMHYMRNHLEKRLDPDQLMQGARSMVCVALNYYPQQKLKENQYQFAWYAYGKDYHDVMKSKLTALLRFIEEQAPPPFQSRIFCDTAPVLERYWAWRAGLGWIGKHTQLILPHAGSCFFLGEILLEQVVDKYDQPQRNRCGNCNRCLNACPTKAIKVPYRLDSKRCLSYLTIESRDAIPPVAVLKLSNKAYGCDECQKACPWNRFATPCRTVELQPTEAFMQMTKEKWNTLTEDQYRTLFKGSAVKRAKYTGLMRNIKAINSDSQSSTNLDDLY